MGLSNSSARSPIPRAGHHASSLIQAASILPRPVRALHRDHGERALLAGLSLFSIFLYFVMPAFTVTPLAEVRGWLLSVEPWSQRLLHHFRPAGARAGRPLLPHRPPSIVRAMLDAIFSEPCFPAVMHLRHIEVSQTVKSSNICSVCTYSTSEFQTNCFPLVGSAVSSFVQIPTSAN
jgi:hypothetical protein